MRRDEIGILYDGMPELLMEIREEQVLKREYHLRLLQYQINPHFLYNSLDTINWKVLEHRDRELTGMIGHLTGFLRAGLDGHDVVSLEQRIVKISLQPLVENAIMHGMCGAARAVCADGSTGCDRAAGFLLQLE